MSLSDLASLGSFISGFAVLVSLVFLYFQLNQLSRQVRQAERGQLASIRSTRTSLVMDLWIKGAEPSLADAIEKVTAGDDDVSPTQIRQFNHFCIARFWHAQNNYHQYLEGLLDDVSFQSLTTNLRMNLLQPGYRVAYRRLRPILGKEFIEFADRILTEARVSPRTDRAEDWKADLVAEKALAIRA